MDTVNSPQQQPIAMTSDEPAAFSSPIFVPSCAPLIPRPALVDSRIKSRLPGVDIDTNKLPSTIKRSQATSNIQALDEDSPVTFVIEHVHARKTVQIQTNPITTSHRPSTELSFSIDHQPIPSGDESDTRSESSEKPTEYLDEDKPILPGIHVKGASLNRLIRILIESFRE